MRVVGDVSWYHYLPDVQMVVEPGTSVGRLLALLGVDPREGLVAINGQGVDVETLLTDGDEIMIRRKGEELGAVSDRG